MAYKRYSAYNGKQPGDPQKGAGIIVDVVRGEGLAAGRKIPSVVAMGSDAVTIIKGALDTALERLETWKDVSESTDIIQSV